MAGSAAEGAPGGGRGWRTLVIVWLVFLAGLGTGAGILAWLGPLPPREVALAAAEAPEAVTAPEVPAPTPAAPASAAPTPATSTPATSTRAAPAAARVATAPPADAPAPDPGPGATADTVPGGTQPIAAPDPDLLEPGPHGPLPRIGPQGRSAIRTYGRAFDRGDTRPRVGLIVGGLGLNASLAEEAIRRLPPGITLAFSPYSPRIDRLLDLARTKGMEVLLALPLEPTGYPLNNPGDRALLTSLSETENQDRLDWVMSRFAGYAGVVGAHGPMRGERFALLPDRLGALQRGLALRGLLYVDPRPGAAQPARAWGRTVDILVDEPATRGEIDRKLAELERMARERGTALGYAGEPSPVLVERVAIWAGQAEGRGLAVAPVSALIRAPGEAAPVAAAPASGPAAPRSAR
jgi:polysaccharide deacetylase 2 family uncharacterized protein YibQ